MKKSNYHGNGLRMLRKNASFIMAALLVILLTMIGCGGETRGTGGGTIGGRVLATDGTPLPNIEVTATGSDDTAFTDGGGNFSLDAPLDVPIVTLQFRQPDGTVKAGSVPLSGNPTSLDVEVQLTPQSNEAQIVVVTPTPTATPVGPTATATSAPPVGETPTATPTAVATSTPTLTPTPQDCPADYNNDGVVNQADYDEFSAVFALGDPAADFDGNGFVNGDDFDAFLDAYAAGC